MNRSLPKNLGLVSLAQLFSTQAVAYDPNFYVDFAERGMIGATVVTVVLAIGALFRLFNTIIKVRELKLYQEQGIETSLNVQELHRESIWARLSRALTRAVPVAQEQDIMLDHHYDGIRELDNRLPPWWLYGFYLSIVIAVTYIGIWHFSDYAISSSEQYAQEVAAAKKAQAAFLARQANLVDETNVTLLQDDIALAEGKEIYQDYCAACHAPQGGGALGPNLTDNYWLHGGSIQDVFKTIKYGVPERGMIAWKSYMRPTDIHKVASYVLSLRGTSPPNPKAPQGELYQAEERTTPDHEEESKVLGMKLKEQ
ncbi:MAG: cbb3-type cytochrome c oxidase N-terminal domain-containing protein [Bacteroidota bacterium]